MRWNLNKQQVVWLHENCRWWWFAPVCMFRSCVVCDWLQFGLGKNMWYIHIHYITYIMFSVQTMADNNKRNLNAPWPDLTPPPRSTSPALSSCATPAAFSPGVLRAVWTVHPVDAGGTWVWRPSDAPSSRVLCSLLGRRFPWQPLMSAATVWRWNRARNLRKVNMPSI